jgi:hypothetical protein
VSRRGCLPKHYLCGVARLVLSPAAVIERERIITAQSCDPRRRALPDARQRLQGLAEVVELGDDVRPYAAQQASEGREPCSRFSGHSSD